MTFFISSRYSRDQIPYNLGRRRIRLQGDRWIMRKPQLLLVVFVLFPMAAFSQPSGWNDPFPAHRVMDNVYFVGTKELASFLITTPQGHILMNSNYESSVPLIQASV